MPSAQGRMTVRRRPKDGENGLDSITYRFIPSASSIVLQKDGTLRPSAVSARLVKNEGGRDIDIVAQAFDGYTVLRHIKKSNGNSTAGYTPGTSLDLTSHAATLLSVVFELKRDSKVVASIDVLCIPAGKDGEDAYFLDLDNEVQGIACDSSGNPIGSGTLATCTATVYKGASVDTGWDFGKNATGCTASITQQGVVSVTEISADNATVKVIANKGSIKREAIMSLYKVKPGPNGESPVVYSIEASVSAISKDKNGTLTPNSITAYKNKTVGSSTVRTNEKTIKYKREGQDTAETTLSGTGGTINGFNDACTGVIITIYDTNGTTVLDKERIPIVKDGADGKPGESYSVVLTPNSVTVKSDGTVVCGAESIQAKAYKNVGGVTVEATNGLMKLVYVTKDGTKSEVASSGIMAEGIGLYSAVWFDYRVNDVTVASAALLINREGPQGIQGCIYRRSKHVTGFKYHNDSTLTTDGIRYIDLVYIMKDSTMFASHALWFRCRQTHTSDANNAPQITSKGTEDWLKYWEPMSTMEPLYTPFLLADDAVITLMQSNQILIANDEGTITAGMSGSLAGSKIRIWAGSQTPDSAPFRVDVDGKVVATKATITGEINATSGKIAGFNISGTSLTNGPEFTNDACIIFRNDTHKTFAGIGGNVLPAVTGNRAVARFENEDANNFWGLGRNIAMLLSAKNGDINHAFLGSGNGNLDGWIGGYKFSKYTLNASNTIYDGYLKISQNNKWIVYATGSNSGIVLPTLTQIRNALGINTTTSFCIEFTVVADILSQNNFHIYGRCKKEVTVNGSTQTPYFTGEYPTMTHWNNGRYDSLEMGAGDAVTFLLIYDSGKSGVLDTSYTLMYTARIINRQN